MNHINYLPENSFAPSRYKLWFQKLVSDSFHFFLSGWQQWAVAEETLCYSCYSFCSCLRFWSLVLGRMWFHYAPVGNVCPRSWRWALLSSLVRQLQLFTFDQLLSLLHLLCFFFVLPLSLRNCSAESLWVLLGQIDSVCVCPECIEN